MDRMTHHYLKICAALFCALGLVAKAAHSQAEVHPGTWPRALMGVSVDSPDLSYLNHTPAGALGRVRASGPDLVFGDGSPARFWGANLQAAALFRTDPAHIQAHARRIASLGFNLVRFHHHDSQWVQPNVLGDHVDGMRQLDQASMDRLDRWVAALKAEGVYVWLDLHVGRVFVPEDGIANFAEIAKGSAVADVRGFNYVSPSIAEQMRAFQQAYLTHLNPYTGLRYSDDPAILAVQLTNENDITQHFGNRLLPNQNVPAHTARYMAQAATFANDHGLDPWQTWKSWEYGPSKLFLNDLEHRFNVAMIADLRERGFDGLVSTTSTWGLNPLSSLPALTAGTIIDVHAYGGPGDLVRDPRQTPGYLDRVAAAQVAGFPLSVSEWNIVDFPADDRFVAPLRMATSAAYQGWDVPIVYGYAQQPLNAPVFPSSWDIAFDLPMIAMMPAAALLYREGHVSPAGQTYALQVPPDAFFGRNISADTSPAIRTLHPQGRLVVTLPEAPELGWLSPRRPPDEATLVTDPDQAYLADGVDVIISDTGETRHDPIRGLLTIDTARTQLAAGRLSGDPVTLSQMTVSSDLTLAAIAVQSLDTTPIAQSRRIMISVTARATPLGQKGTTFGVEPLVGELHLRAPDDLILTTGGGKSLPERAHRFENGAHIIDLARLTGRNWLVLASPPR